MSSTELPALRWGIITTGFISGLFVSDLVHPRGTAKAKHVIQAIGTSSIRKGEAFVKKVIPNHTPTIYASYSEVFNDPSVDIVYIATPHAFHARNCLDAIAAGKHILCEKAFTLTARQARTVFDAAVKKNVFVMEAMWIRFKPLVQTLRKVLHEKKVIGDIQRVFSDFSMEMGIDKLGPESRLRNPALGAGSLLDIGIYSLTYGLLSLDPKLGSEAPKASVLAAQKISDGIDVATSTILSYPSGQHGILSSSITFKTPRNFCRIEGTGGYVVISGPAASVPDSFIVHRKGGDEGGETYEFEQSGYGFYYEADAVAVDIAAGRTENADMPWAETLRVLEILDEIRRQGGARFPADDEEQIV